MHRINRRHALAGIAALGLTATLSTTASADDGTDAKAVYARYIDEVINGGNLDAIDELVTEDYAPQGGPDELPGREALKQRMATQMAESASMMDVVLLTDAVIVEGDTLAARHRWSGMMGGEHRDVLSLAIVTMRDNQIAAMWFLVDSPY